MSNRLDKDREAKLEPKRMEHALEQIKKLGYSTGSGEKYIIFEHKGEIVRFFPYSGWATGKSIRDCRGLNNLLKQLNK